MYHLTYIPSVVTVVTCTNGCPRFPGSCALNVVNAWAFRGGRGATPGPQGGWQRVFVVKATLVPSLVYTEYEVPQSGTFKLRFILYTQHSALQLYR